MFKRPFVHVGRDLEWAWSVDQTELTTDAAGAETFRTVCVEYKTGKDGRGIYEKRPESDWNLLVPPEAFCLSIENELEAARKVEEYFRENFPKRRIWAAEKSDPDAALAAAGSNRP